MTAYLAAALDALNTGRWEWPESHHPAWRTTEDRQAEIQEWEDQFADLDDPEE